MINVNCACANTKCKMRGDCKKCMDFHNGKTYCKSSPFIRAVARVGFKFYDTVISKFIKQ
jgi:hypothetical protein